MVNGGFQAGSPKLRRCSKDDIIAVMDRQINHFISVFYSDIFNTASFQTIFEDLIDMGAAKLMSVRPCRCFRGLVMDKCDTQF